MKQKLLQCLMLIAALSTGISANAYDFEAQNSDGVTIYYNIISSYSKTCKVTYAGDSYSSYSNEYKGSIVIPETVTYNGTTYSITSIGKYAFRGCTGLTSVTIGNSVTSIDSWAFLDCTSLTTIKVETGNSKYDSRNNCNAIIETESNTLIAGYFRSRCRDRPRPSLFSIYAHVGKMSVKQIV